MRQDFRPNPPAGTTWYRLPGWPRLVDIGSDLDPGDRKITAGHELGHVIGRKGFVTTNNIMGELRTLYNTINNPNRTGDGSDAAPGRAVTPESFNYEYWRAIEDEYIAETIRAYATDPNFVKSVAPNVAAAIRRAVNNNPRLNRVIHFNSLRFPTHAGFGGPFGYPPTASG